MGVNIPVAGENLSSEMEVYNNSSKGKQICARENALLIRYLNGESTLWGKGNLSEVD